MCLEKAKERAEAAGIEVPDKIPGETRPRKSTVPSQQEKTITLRICWSSTKQGYTAPFWIPILKRWSDDSKERRISKQP